MCVCVRCATVRWLWKWVSFPTHTAAQGTVPTGGQENNTTLWEAENDITARTHRNTQRQKHIYISWQTHTHWTNIWHQLSEPLAPLGIPKHEVTNADFRELKTLLQVNKDQTGDKSVAWMHHVSCVCGLENKASGKLCLGVMLQTRGCCCFLNHEPGGFNVTANDCKSSSETIAI